MAECALARRKRGGSISGVVLRAVGEVVARGAGGDRERQAVEVLENGVQLPALGGILVTARVMERQVVACAADYAVGSVVVRVAVVITRVEGVAHRAGAAGVLIQRVAVGVA